MSERAGEVVGRFWETMNTNDFRAVGTLLADGSRLEWPQSGEVIRGWEDFARINQNAPASGPWRFTVYKLIAGGAEVVSDVGVTDGVVKARAITSTVEGGLIVRQIEFWPDPYDPPPEISLRRRAWAECV